MPWLISSSAQPIVTCHLTSVIGPSEIGCSLSFVCCDRSSSYIYQANPHSFLSPRSTNTSQAFSCSVECIVVPQCMYSRQILTVYTILLTWLGSETSTIATSSYEDPDDAGGTFPYFLKTRVSTSSPSQLYTPSANWRLSLSAEKIL